MLWFLWRACSTVVNWNTPTWIDSAAAETVHAGRIHLRKLQPHSSPFHLGGWRHWASCYFQLRQDFRLTKILTLCKLKTCQVCLGLVKLQFYKRKSQLFGGTEVLLWCCHDFQTGSQHQSFEPQPIKLGGPPTNDMQFVDSKGWSKMFEWFRMRWHPLESVFNCWPMV